MLLEFLVIHTLSLLIQIRFANATSSSWRLRIVGGHEIQINEVPYLVKLFRNGKFQCGGSLITSQCVLTAAHCVHEEPPSIFSIAAGSSKLSDNAVIQHVQQIYVPKSYTPETLDMDVAVLKLSAPIMGQNIQTIKMCAYKPPSGKQVQIAGWGQTSESNIQSSNQVQAANITMISKNDCKRAYKGLTKISSSMFCASSPGERDACFGDSGGPLVYKGRVCGIVSWGSGCGHREYPGVYTDIASSRVKDYVHNVVVKECL